MSRAGLCVTLFLLAPLAPLGAQGAAPLPLDPLVRSGVLDNGLRYFIRANREPEQRAELRLAVRVGSVVEDDDQRGLAHFAEHMAFNGTTSFPKNDLIHYLQSIGSEFGADVNAYTSFDETVYQLHVPTDTSKFLETGIQILGEWAHGVTFDSAEVEAERGVVIEEWRLGRGADARMFDQQLPVLLRGSRYAERLVIGSQEALAGFSREALVRFYRRWYRPEMMAVVAVGDFDADSVESLIRRHFAAIPAGNGTARPDFAVPAHDSVYVLIATDPEATASVVQLYHLRPRQVVATMDDFRRRYVEGLALDMLGDRFAEIIERPDKPFAFAGAGRFTLVATADAVSLYAGVEPDSMVRGFEAALVELERARRHGFTAGELARTLASQSAAQERLYQERDKQPSAARADELVRHFLQGEDVLGTEAEVEAYRRINPTVTVEEVNAAARALLAASSPVILVNAPAGDGARLPTEAALLAAYQAVGSRTIEPYRDSTVSSQLLATIPEPVAITAERAMPELGLTEWTLANGVRVVLKPTDFRNDEVVLSATSPGGVSLYPDSLVASAMFADAVAELGGVGSFSAADLRKALSGKVVSAGASIGERTEGISGRSNARDVETMLQLTYLRFTAPRRDSSAFEAFRQTMRTALANVDASPMKAFSDTVTAVLTRHSPRVRPMSAALFDEINLDRALAIYRDRFADASDFTFFLVGSFALDSVRPLVQRYLGNLPSTGRQEAARDVGPTPPTGRIERIVRKGSEPQSQTMMVFSQPFTWDARENHLLASLGAILSNRLLDNLRERLGGTYGASASVQGNRDHPHVALGMVQFGSAPDRVEELVAAVHAEIRALADSGPSAAELEKVREAQIRSRETAIRTNGFWATRLSQAWRYGEDPADILRFRELVDGLTAERVRDAARRYLTGDNYVRVTLLPAEVTP